MVVRGLWINNGGPKPVCLERRQINAQSGLLGYRVSVTGWSCKEAALVIWQHCCFTTCCSLGGALTHAQSGLLLDKWVGLARSIYVHRTWPCIWWFSCQKYQRGSTEEMPENVHFCIQKAATHPIDTILVPKCSWHWELPEHVPSFMWTALRAEIDWIKHTWCM